MHPGLPLSLESLSARRARLLGPAYRLFYDHPLHLVRGEGAWVWDTEGRRYLDAYNNVPHVGHCHPRVVEAIRAQAATLNTHTRYLHEAILACSERLLDRLPAVNRGTGPSASPDWQVMYACSGTEANDLTLRIARAATGNEGVIVTEHAYHGNSGAITPLSTEDTPSKRRGDHIVTIPAPCRYRCPVDGAAAAAHYLEAVDRAIETLAERGHRPAALFLDTVLSSEGVPDVPEGWLAAAVDRVRAAGGLFVADEVQAGFARTGTHFWGFQRLGALPDLVTMGKPMGNGHPVSAVVARPELLARFAADQHYFNTFGGNPVSCAAVLAVLAVMGEEDLQARAVRTGEVLRAGLLELAGRFEVIGDVRGSGLFFGVDLVLDRDSRAPDAGLARRVMNGMREAGVLVGVTGAGGNVVKVRPPMVFGEGEVGVLLGVLEGVLGAEGG